MSPWESQVPLGPDLIYKLGSEGTQHLFEDTQWDLAKQEGVGGVPGLEPSNTDKGEGGPSIPGQRSCKHKGPEVGIVLSAGASFGVPREGGTGTETACRAEVQIPAVPGTCHVWPWSDHSPFLPLSRL